MIERIRKIVSGPDLTTAEASRILGIQRATIRQQIKNKRLAGIKRGRDWFFTRSELRRYRRDVQGH